MRHAFVHALEKEMSKDKDIMLLTADLGFGALDKIKEKYPKQFVNVGVAEQNMMGLAAGLALNGKKVWAYSIIPFSVYRPYEQIRNDIAYHNLNVKIVGVGSGFSYSNQGMSHWGLEDLALMGTLPAMTVVAPGDPIEVECAVKELSNTSGPGYLRLGKAGEKELNKRPLNYELGKANYVREGKDLSLISTGNMLETALEVADELAKKDLFADVISMHTFKPIDRKAVIDSAMKKVVCTLEEHMTHGGLGGAVADIIAQSPYKPKLKIFGVANNADYVRVAGSQAYVRDKVGLTKEKIAEYIQRCMI